MKSLAAKAIEVGLVRKHSAACARISRIKGLLCCRILGFLLVCLTSSLAQPIIIEQPQNQTVAQGTTANFTVVATGTPPLSYQWRSYANGTTFTNIPFGTEATLLLTNAQPTSRRFGVVVSDSSGSATSRLATLTVTLSGPLLLSASSLTGGDVGVCFSRPMNPSGLNVPGNYQVRVSGVTVPVSSVSPWQGNTAAVLRLSQPISGVFTVVAQQLTDLALIPLGNVGPVTGRVWGASISVSTVGALSPPGEFISFEEGRVADRCGGSFLTAMDFLHYLHQPRTNDFDVQVRVDSLVKLGDLNGTGLTSAYIAGAGLMARNSLDPSSPAIGLVAEPSNGSRFPTYRGWRPGAGSDVAYLWGNSAEHFPSWLRLRRSGNRFASYSSTNGIDWESIDEPQEFREASPVMEVGLITVSWTDGIDAIAEYRDFGDTRIEQDANALVSVTRPPVAVTIEAGHSATFDGLASVSGAPATDLSYQWQAETSPGSGVFTNVFFGTSTRFVTPPLTLADSGTRVRFFARVTGGPAVVSAPAVVTVVPDATPPRVLSVTGRNGGSELVVTFSEAMDPSSAVDLFAYNGGDFGVVDATIDESGTRVTLMLGTPIDLATSPELTIAEPHDAAGLTIDPNPSVLPVTAPVVEIGRGGARRDLFFGINGVSLSNLRGDPRFPGSPDLTETVTQLEGAINVADNYGTLISGFLVPPVAGNYNFWISSDDQGEFWLSTDENPANLVLTCREPAWSGYRQYNSFVRRDPAAPENRSTTLFPAGIPLVPEQRYYFEALSKEGPGADLLSVAWQIPGGPAPLDGGPPIPGAYLAMATGSEPGARSIQITRQPSNVVALVPVSSSIGRLLLAQGFGTTGGGFVVQQTGIPGGDWSYEATTGVWFANGSDFAEKLLTSPWITITSPGSVRLSFRHRFSFEEGMYDGGRVRLSANGGPFVPVPRQNFLSNSYTGPIGGQGALYLQEAFGNTSPGYAAGEFLTSVADLGVFLAGDRIAIQFQGSWDGSEMAPTPNWVIDSLELMEGLPGHGTATFSVQVVGTTDSGGAVPLSFVWQRDCGQGFSDIIGANEATYQLPASTADAGCRFRCVIYTPGAVATSEVATLTVSLPPITIVRDTEGVSLQWTGGPLQHAPEPGGPWSDLPTAISPMHVSFPATNRFYRVIAR